MYVGKSTLHVETTWSAQAQYDEYCAALEAVERQADLDGDAETMWAAIDAQHAARRAYYGA